jgi:hypothetical protein
MADVRHVDALRARSARDLLVEQPKLITGGE